VAFEKLEQKPATELSQKNGGREKRVLKARGGGGFKKGFFLWIWVRT